MSAHWPGGSIGRVVGFADCGPLRGCMFVYGYVGKIQLVLAKEIATKLFKLSAQPQFFLHLNCCAVHTSRNNDDLIKQTHRERRLRVLPMFSGRPVIFLTGRAWHIQLWSVDQSGYVDLTQQLCSVAHPWAAASLHIILAISKAAGLTKLFPAV